MFSRPYVAPPSPMFSCFSVCFQWFSVSWRRIYKTVDSRLVVAATTVINVNSASCIGFYGKLKFIQQLIRQVFDSYRPFVF